jgi:hypothetical protein
MTSASDAVDGSSAGTRVPWMWGANKRFFHSTLLRCMSLFTCRFSDAGNRGSIHTRGRPASEKRRGRKSRVGSSAAVRRALWGFSRGAGREEVGQKRLVTELRHAITAYTDQGNKLYVPFFQGLLAEIEAEARRGRSPDPDRRTAMARLTRSAVSRRMRSAILRARCLRQSGSCQNHRVRPSSAKETVTVPSEDGGTRQIRIIRC